MLFLLNKPFTLLIESRDAFLLKDTPWMANFLTKAPTIKPDVTRDAVLKILFMTMVVYNNPLRLLTIRLTQKLEGQFKIFVKL